MDIKRDIYNKLLEWKEHEFNLVLELHGARQVGKTYILKKFAKENFTHFIYINMAEATGKKFLKCIEMAERWEVGEKGSEKPLYDAIKLYNADFIDNENTLILIDEIQESALVYNAIRTFAREFKSGVIVTGSYLGRTINREFFYPAGDIYKLELGTITFEEFLDIFGKRTLYKTIDLFGSSNHTEYDELKKYFDDYMQMGGYPSVINAYLDGKRGNELKQEIRRIIDIFINESNAYLTDIKDQKALSNILLPITQTMIKEKKGSSNLIVELQKIMSSDSNKVSKKSINHAIAWLFTSNIIGYCGKAMECNILDIVQNIRFYFTDIGVANYLLTWTGVDRGTINGLLMETFVYRYLQKMHDNSLLANNTPIFGSYKDGELDFLAKNLNSYELIGIEVKAGNNIAETGNLLLNDKKIDKLYLLKGDSYGGITENKYTIPLYLCGRLKFDGIETNL